MMRRAPHWVVLSLGLGLPAADLTAQDPPPVEIAYSTNSSNDQILKLAFDTGASVVVNTDAAQRVRLEGLAVRDDGTAQHLVVCDRGSGEVLFYENAAGAGQVITAAIDHPHSVSLDQAGNAYVVSTPQRQVWKLPIGGQGPGGYGAPVLIDTVTSSSSLMEAKVAPYSAGDLQSGGLVVLSRVPFVMYFYPPDPQSPTGFGPRRVLLPNSAFPKGSQPSGFAFAPKQELLVALNAGRVLRFDSSGKRVSPPFATGAGKGAVQIAVGVQSGKSYALVTDQKGGGRIKRFLIGNSGTGTLDGVVTQNVSAPGGVNIPQGAPTPVGQNVVVQPAPETILTFDKVVTAGISTAQIVEFVDTRGQLNGGNYFVAQPLKDFFDPGDPLFDQLPSMIIPPHVQAFRKGDPNTGTPTFLLAILDTTATFERTVEVHYDEAAQLGYEPDCADPDTTRRPRTFYAPQIAPPKSEPPIVEGNVFVNFSTGCGSNIGRGGGFSFWLTGRELDAPADTADAQLANMQAAMDFYPCIDPDVKPALETELQAAVAAFEAYKQSGDPDDQAEALARLAAYNAVVDANPAAFVCTPVNVAGELIARAEAAKFSIVNTVVSNVSLRQE
jgi:hypothetical protein